MKFIIPLMLLASVSSFAAQVMVIVRASPCTGGPNNCGTLMTAGKLTVQNASGEERFVKVSRDGMTEISLNPGRYTFHYLVKSPVGGSEALEQEVVELKKRYNLVVLDFDTGIR